MLLLGSWLLVVAWISLVSCESANDPFSNPKRVSSKRGGSSNNLYNKYNKDGTNMKREERREERRGEQSKNSRDVKRLLAELEDSDYSGGSWGNIQRRSRLNRKLMQMRVSVMTIWTSVYICVWV